MSQRKVIDIMDEEFEIPVVTPDLQELIEESIEVYNKIEPLDKLRRHYRAKLNELIAEYNERRGMNIYSHIK